MRPTLVDVLANNSHLVTVVVARSQTVICYTKNGVAVSWGHGSHGKLGYGAEERKSSSKPEFVGPIDSCLVFDVACGMGHTLFIIRNDDAEDAKSLKKVDKVEDAGIVEFVEQIKGERVGMGEGGERTRNKTKGKWKK